MRKKLILLLGVLGGALLLSMSVLPSCRRIQQISVSRDVKAWSNPSGAPLVFSKSIDHLEIRETKLAAALQMLEKDLFVSITNQQASEFSGRQISQDPVLKWFLGRAIKNAESPGHGVVVLKEDEKTIRAYTSTSRYSHGLLAPMPIVFSSTTDIQRYFVDGWSRNPSRRDNVDALLYKLRDWGLLDYDDQFP